MLKATSVPPVLIVAVGALLLRLTVTEDSGGVVQ